MRLVQGEVMCMIPVHGESEVHGIGARWGHVHACVNTIC